MSAKQIRPLVDTRGGLPVAGPLLGWVPAPANGATAPDKATATIAVAPMQQTTSAPKLTASQLHYPSPVLSGPAWMGKPVSVPALALAAGALVILYLWRK